MRYIGLILALGAICWVLYQAAGGGEAETVITAEQQQSLDKAKGMEDALQEAALLDEARKAGLQRLD